DAYGLPDPQEDFGLDQRRDAGRGGREDRWQRHALAVARPVSAGVIKALRRGIEELNTLKTVTGQLDLRWDTCLPRIAPIGLPAGFQTDLQRAAQGALIIGDAGGDQSHCSALRFVPIARCGLRLGREEEAGEKKRDSTDHGAWFAVCKV